MTRLDTRFDTWLHVHLKNYNFQQNPQIYYWFHQFWEESADKRSEDMFLVGLSLLGFSSLVIGSYLFVVFVLIPEVMRKRPALSLRRTMIVYNMLMVFLNAYFFFKALFLSNFGRRLLDLSNPKTDHSPEAQEFMRVAHYYFLSKILDFMDTVFMALKKKHAQISFLHVWHHVSMVFAGWLYMKYNPLMPTSLIIPLINGFVHVLMYSYYALSAFGPRFERFLWWKRYMTRIQLIQMVVVFVYFLVVTVLAHHVLPSGYLAAMLGNAFFLFLLFLKFYLNNYNKKIKSN